MLRLEMLECRENPSPIGPRPVDPTATPIPVDPFVNVPLDARIGTILEQTVAIGEGIVVGVVGN